MRRAKSGMLVALFLSAVCAASVFPQSESRPAEPAAASYTLTITDRDSRAVAEIPLKNGRFDHVYLHSIHLTPVVERFMVLPGPTGSPTLHLYELVYESYGVGMPSDTENGFRLEDGKFILEMSRDFAVIPLMVSTVDGHGIVADGHFFAFSDWVPKETFLFLAAKASF